MCGRSRHDTISIYQSINSSCVFFYSFLLSSVAEVSCLVFFFCIDEWVSGCVCIDECGM